MHYKTSIFGALYVKRFSFATCKRQAFVYIFDIVTQSIVKFCHLSTFPSIILPPGIIYDICSVVRGARTRRSVQKLVNAVDGMSSHQSKPSK